MTFLDASLDLFLGNRSSHMGSYQYAGHTGMRHGRSTSGALLWAEAEAKRHASSGNMVNAETRLLQKVASEIARYVPSGTTVVELGPGTTAAFKNKTLPIIRSLGSANCVLVDESVAFLKNILAAEDLKAGLKIKHYVNDFFQNESAYFDDQALVCSFGSTISNIINPVSKKPPEKSLVDSLATLGHAAHDGWMLIGLDSDQDGKSIKSYFKQHGLFQLNIFDRMAAELPVKGFDPLAFEYEPEWIASSGQLAHIAVVNRDVEFLLADTVISLKRGQKLHIKNSYKFSPDFFEDCCAFAGLEVVTSWSDDTPALVYLLKLSSLKNSLYDVPCLKAHPKGAVAA